MSLSTTKLPLLPDGIQKMALSFSGGGFRAASFSLGCVSFLHHLPYGGGNLLDKVKFISSASGGSITNLMLCRQLRLNKDFIFVFQRLTALMNGCDLMDEVFFLLNDEHTWNTRPGKSRNLINAFAIAYDSYFFKGATLSSLSDEPAGGGYVVDETCINTTEFDNGLNFRFGTKGVIGNKYLYFKEDAASKQTAGRIKLGDILACSSCFPGGFEPMMFPNDLTNSDLSEDQLEKSIFQSDHYSGAETADSLKNKTIRFGFMDGGIDDNQGIYAFLLADQRVAGNYDFYFTCDVTSNFLEHPFEYPADAAHQLFEQNVQALKRKVMTFITRYIIGAMLLLAAGIILAFFHQTRSLGLVLSGAGGMALLLPGISYRWGKKQILKLMTIFMPPSPSNGAENSWMLIFNRYKDQLLKLSVNRLIGMLLARASSVLLLATTVYLKKIRRISYNYLYAVKGQEVYKDLVDQVNSQTATLPLDPGALWKDHIGATTIYLLSTKNDFMLRTLLNNSNIKGRTVSATDNRLITEVLHSVAKMIRPVADIATRMDTTLWFDENQVASKYMESIIATGQASMCFNLILTVYQFGNNDKEWIELKANLVTAWENFGRDPFWLYKLHQQQTQNLTKPTFSEITVKVKDVLKEKANINISSIIDGRKLTEWPLSLDATALGFIALALSNYVEGYNPKKTVTVSEVRKEGLLVSGLIKLIADKIIIPSQV